MSEVSQQKPDTSVTRSRVGGLAARLTVELVTGLSLAAVLMLVAWASSSAIRFVYGGY